MKQLHRNGFRAKKAEFRGTDGKPLAWFWAIGKGPVHYRGQIHPWHEHWEEWTSSLMEFVRVFQPCCIAEHDKDTQVWGTAKDMRILTRAEAIQLGIPQEHEEALYVGIELNKLGRTMDDNGELLYSSVRVDYDWSDDSNREWPAALKEFSRVIVPHLITGHVPRPTLKGIQLAEDTDMDMDAKIEQLMAAVAALQEQVGVLTALVVPAEDPDEVMEELEEAAAEVADAVEADAEDMTAEETDEDEELEADEDEKDGKSVELKEQVARLSKRLQASEQRERQAVATRMVDSIASTHIVDAKTRAKLVELRASGDARLHDAFDTVVANLRKRPATSGRIALSGADSLIDEDTAARRLRASEEAKGNEITYTEALGRIRRNRKG